MGIVTNGKDEEIWGMGRGADTYHEDRRSRLEVYGSVVGTCIAQEMPWVPSQHSIEV